ncbi:MAG: hypothetical protein AB1894_26870 [Chloroflexota bacterium]
MLPAEKPRRPFSVTLLVIVVLIVAVTYLLRLVQALAQWEFLSNWLLVPPLYLALTGLVWASAGLSLAGSLWMGKRWARPAFWLAFAAFSLYFWVDRLLLPGYPQRNANWPFLAGLHLCCLAFSYWVLSRAKAKSYFGAMHE